MRQAPSTAGEPSSAPGQAGAEEAPTAALSVLHVSQTTVGGAAQVAAALAHDQRRRGWRVTVACPDGPDLAEAARRAGARHERWTRRRQPGRTAFGVREAAGAAVAEAFGLARIVRRTRPDIVHLHSTAAGLTGRLVLRGRRPTVFQPHGWSFLALSGWRGVASTAWERLGARWCAALLCVSEGERVLGEQAGVQASWRVIPNGVEAGAFSDGDRAVARRQLGLDDAPLAVVPGRVCRAKGQDLLIDAWPAVRSRVRDAHLAIVGDGPDRSGLELRAPAGVRFVGWSETVPEWLQAADVVVLPSRWEAGLCLAAMEAMASHRSVVATDVAGSREGLRDGAGAVVGVERPTELAAAVSERLLDPERAATEGRAGRATVEERYALEASTDAVADLYLGLTAATSPAK